jgi:2,5-diketo-D-gluconate reductase A
MLAHDIEPVAASPLGRSGSKMGPQPATVLTDEQILVEIAKQHEKTPAQIALAWGLARGYTVIPKAASPAH